MLVRSVLAGLDVREVPVTLGKDGRSRRPHLRRFRDGWRHLRFLLLFSPRWLFLIPGIVLSLVGGGFGVALLFGPIRIGSVGFDVGTLLYCAAMLLVGAQSVAFAVVTKTYAIGEGFLPRDARFDRLHRYIKLETGLIVGAVLFLLGLVVALLSFSRWRDAGFGGLDPAQQVRVVTPAVVGFALGCQVILVSLLLSILNMRDRTLANEATLVDDVGASDA